MPSSAFTNGNGKLEENSVCIVQHTHTHTHTRASPFRLEALHRRQNETSHAIVFEWHNPPITDFLANPPPPPPGELRGVVILVCASVLVCVSGCVCVCVCTKCQPIRGNPVPVTDAQRGQHHTRTYYAQQQYAR